LFYDVHDRNRPPIIKYCDFGLSKFYTAQEPQTPRMVTIWYRAPEIAMSKDYDAKVDIWSLGCVFYEMIVRSPLLRTRSYPGEPEKENLENLEVILRNLPKRLPPSETKKLKAKYKLRLPRGKKRSFHKMLFSSPSFEQEFNKKVGDARTFSKMVMTMLEFYPSNRPTASELLNNSFFDDFRKHIKNIRRKYLKNCFQDSLVTINNCVQRKWMANLAFYFYNKHRKGSIRWYKHRIMFQAIDLFDRYLASCDKVVEERGQIEYNFLTCIYIAIKYFATLETPISYIDISEQHFSIASAREFASEISM
jgi:serine/threonine protein kinase